MTAGGRAAVSTRGEITPFLIVAGLALVVLVALGILPAKTWFGQRQKLDEAHQELARVNAESEELRRELEMLETDEEIERRARRDFDLVYPGEESYRILPSAPADDGLTPVP